MDPLKVKRLLRATLVAWAGDFPRARSLPRPTTRSDNPFTGSQIRPLSAPTVGREERRSGSCYRSEGVVCASTNPGSGARHPRAYPPRQIVGGEEVSVWNGSSVAPFFGPCCS